MKSIEIKTAVVCDDIRQEIGGKFILIGVYADAIFVPQFPIDLALSYWIQILPRDLEEHTMEMRLVNEANVALVSGEFTFRVREIKLSLMPLSGLVFQAQSEGNIRLQLREAGVEEWESVKEIPIRLRFIRHPSAPNVSPRPS